MADAITIKALQDASLDAKSLEEVVNGNDTKQVTTRLGENYPSVKKAIKTLFENGGLPAAPFKTKALMTASALADGKYAMVTDETANNGLYVKTSGAWVKSSYDPLAQIAQNTMTNQSFNESAYTIVGFIDRRSGVLNPDAAYLATDFIRIEPETEYTYISAMTGSAGGAFYSKDKGFISGFTGTLAPTELKVVSPPQARYVRISKTTVSPSASFVAKNKFNLGELESAVMSLDSQLPIKQYHGYADFTISGKFINKDTGVLVTAPEYSSTRLIAIEPNNKYIAFSTSTSIAGSAWYDKQGDYISGFAPNTKMEVTSPSNAAFVAMSSLNTEVGGAFIESVKERYNVDMLLKVLGGRIGSDGGSQVTNFEEVATAKPMLFDTVVKSKLEAQAVNPYGASDKAYPIGRRIYDHSLRSELYADGSFWRLPDGSAASLAKNRVYVYPDWDEIRSKLPTYAKTYEKVYDVSDGVVGWLKQGLVTDTQLSVDGSYGDNRLRIEHKSGTSGFVYKSIAGAVTEKDTFVFDYHFDFSKLGTYGLEIGLLNSAGDVLYRRILLSSSVMGANARTFNPIDYIRAEVLVSKMTETSTTAQLSDVTHVGFKVISVAGQVGWISLGNVEKVRFKPKITLRFDDQRASVYANAYPIMEQYGLQGMIAVITGESQLGNDPNYINSSPRMSKAQLLEVRDKGWDLVSHTHSHIDTNGKTDEYIREDFRKSSEYLRNELKVGDICSSYIIAPYGARDERTAMIQREFFDAGVNKLFLNSHMPRQPEGTWEKGSLWSCMGAFDGDNTALGSKLIGFAQQTIADNGWGIVMMHDVFPTLENVNTTTIAAFTEFCSWLAANKADIDVVTVSSVVKQIRPEA